MALLITLVAVIAVANVITAIAVVSGRGTSAEATASSEDDASAEAVFQRAVLERIKKAPAAR